LNSEHKFKGALKMGKGDQRSRRGKIWRGTFGKRRPKKSKGDGKPAAATGQATATDKKQVETSN
jgi:30S ribosomal protein S31